MWSTDMPHSQKEYPIIGLSLVAPFSACTKVHTKISTTQCTCVPDVEVFEDLRVEIINLSRHIQNIANTIYMGQKKLQHIMYITCISLVIDRKILWGYYMYLCFNLKQYTT